MIALLQILIHNDLLLNDTNFYLTFAVHYTNDRIIKKRYHQALNCPLGIIGYYSVL